METTSGVSEADTILFLVITYGVALVLVVIPSLAVMWQLYSKASKPGWAAIVPIYNSIVMGQIAQKMTAVWIMLSSYAIYLATTFVQLAAISAVVALVVLISALYVLNSFIKKYDAGLGRWILFIFIPIIGVFLVKPVSYKGGSQPTLPTQSPGTPVEFATQSAQTPAVEPPAYTPPVSTPLQTQAPSDKIQ